LTLVVDSSVAIKWFTPEPLSSHADELLRSEELLIAPALILAEVANAMWRKARLGEVTENQVSEAIEELQTTITLHPIDARLTGAAFDIARAVGHSIYDCMFLACAIAEKTQLVTADAKFASKVADARFRGVVRLLAN
jgi:predicted nucleic acid-binding protein